MTWWRRLKLVDWPRRLTHGPKGTITLGGQMAKVVADPAIPPNTMYILAEPLTWEQYDEMPGPCLCGGPWIKYKKGALVIRIACLRCGRQPIHLLTIGESK